MVRFINFTSIAFKGTEEMVLRRYNTIRTRVGRHLSKYRKSGSGTDDTLPVPPEMSQLRWLFKFIKTKQTLSNISDNAVVSNECEDEVNDVNAMSTPIAGVSADSLVETSCDVSTTERPERPQSGSY